MISYEGSVLSPVRPRPTTEPPVYDDLRSFVAALEERGLLRRVRAEVDWDLEVGAIQRKVFDRGGPALLFERVRGHDTSLASGVLGTPERYALGIGCPPDLRSIIAQVRDATKHPIAPVIVDHSACQQNIQTGSAIDIREFPTPRWHALDGGRYLGTLGVVVTKDPETGARNVGIYREQILGADRLALNATQQLGTLWQKWQRAGRPMPVATAVGVDPCTLAASCIQAPLGDDEYAISGALRGQPLELVRCISQDLDVPAGAEIILEGEIAPDGDLVDEGPFGEFTGYYGLRKKSPVVQLTAVTHRDRPILQGTLEGAPPNESTTLRSIGSTAGAWAKLERMGFPGVKDFYITDMGCANFMTVVSMERSYYFGHAKQLIEAIWANIHIAKWVIVVNDDIDVFDRGQVEWALSTRVLPSRDIWITPQNQPGTNLDPAIAPEDRLYPNIRGARVGIDATEDFKGYQFPPQTRPSAEESACVEARWAEYGID
jgi:4-hydroxy-3-polyprenylbenzoate decarboxylase